MATRGRRVHSIEKSIQLLDCFWQMRRPLALSELERMTGWAKSTIHGLLASMLDSAVVEQNATDGKYRLGYHLFELGSAVSQGWDVPEICTPHLQRIVDQIQESAYLARLSGDELILVACEEPHAGFRVASEAGTRLPLHCTSQGKIILANRPANEVQALLRRLSEEAPEKLVLLGDILYHGPRNALPRDYDTKACAAMLNALEKAPLCVRGNCDGEVDQMVLNFPVLADFAAVFADGYALYLTHGHHLDEASKAAAPGDIVLYGHTHVPAFEQKNGNYYVNPGSVSIPKEGSRHSYMLWENGVFTWKDVETGEIWRTERIEK